MKELVIKNLSEKKYFFFLVLLFCLVTFFFIKPEPPAPENLQRESNRLIMLISGNPDSPTDDPLYFLLKNALIDQGAPALFSFAYIPKLFLSMLDNYAFLNKITPEELQVNSQKKYQDYYKLFESIFITKELSFYRVSQSTLFLCVHKDHQEFKDLIERSSDVNNKNPSLIKIPIKPIYKILFDELKNLLSVFQNISIHDLLSLPLENLTDDNVKIIVSRIQQIAVLLKKEIVKTFEEDFYNPLFTDNLFIKKDSNTVQGNFNLINSNPRIIDDKSLITYQHLAKIFDLEIKKAENLGFESLKVEEQVKPKESDTSREFLDKKASSKPWHIFWCGHGGKRNFFTQITEIQKNIITKKETEKVLLTNTIIGNIDIFSLQQMLMIFNKIGVKSLLLMSCFSGGKHREYIEPKIGKLSYPIALLSTSEQIIWAKGSYNFSDYFKALEAQENQRVNLSQASLPWFEDAILNAFTFLEKMNIENSLFIRPPYNEKFYFFIPQEQESIDGYISPPTTTREKMALFYGALLENNLKKHTIEKQPFSFNAKAHLLVYPEIIDQKVLITPLLKQGVMSDFTSYFSNIMFPPLNSLRKGHAVHLFKEIEIQNPEYELMKPTHGGEDFFRRDIAGVINVPAARMMLSFFFNSFTVNSLRLSKKLFL